MEEKYIDELNPNDVPLYFEPTYWAHLQGADNRHLVTLTGATKIPLDGKNSQDWTDYKLRVHLRFPNICPPGKALQLESWAPFFTISGINKGGDNHNGGWAVYDFGIDPGYKMITTAISIWTTVRVRGAQFEVLRIGYALTVSGVLVDYKPPGPV